MTTYIRFGDDHSVAVLEEYGEIKELIAAAEAKAVPMFEVRRIDGARLYVNATEVWTISEGKKKKGS